MKSGLSTQYSVATWLLCIQFEIIFANSVLSVESYNGKNSKSFPDILKSLQNALSRTSIRPSHIDTLCIASKHGINAPVNAQAAHLCEFLTRNLACIRLCSGNRRRRRAKNDTFKPERRRDQLKNKMNQRMKGEIMRMCQSTRDTS